MSVDLRTTYLGLELRSPLIASSSPLTRRPASLAEIEAAGAGAVVLPSLFEEQIEAEARHVDLLLDHGSDIFGEASSFFPQQVVRATTVDDHPHGARGGGVALDPGRGEPQRGDAGRLDDVRRVLEGHRVAALELNLYRVAADPDHSAADVENALVEVVREVRAEVAVPLAVKLGPFFSSLPHLARRLVDAGADGLVLFNRFYQPDLDLETMRAVPHLVLSTSTTCVAALDRAAARTRRRLARADGRAHRPRRREGGPRGADAVTDDGGCCSTARARPDAPRDRCSGSPSTATPGREARGAPPGAPARPDGFERANYLDVLAAGEAGSEGRLLAQ
jgi:hypothetical protein